MNKPIIHNLDEKQNPPEYIRLGGIDMDISFIPCGVAIPLTKAYDEWTEYINNSGGKDGIENNIDKAHDAAMLMAKTLAVLTKFYDEKLDEEWILKNVTLPNLGFAITKIIKIIIGSTTDSKIIKNTNIDEVKKKENQLTGNEQ